MLLIPAGLLLVSFSVLPVTAQTERPCTPVGGSCASSSNCCFNPVVSCSGSSSAGTRTCSLPNFSNVSPGTASFLRMVMTFIIMALNQFFGQMVPPSLTTTLNNYLK
ncbi:hypothetical protein GE061_005305 [Apolygus lucorum]|uniref:WAP domain-containing protein n=1 Tax=Apolygus lucorum TaxID=248454 RepID=A0A8S9WXM6_APOLU|nr:hypothetical protein GE061_005305 [Apolygus lucorum]